MSISAGEWLQGFAAILGVFLTVRATMYLEDRKRRIERSEEVRLVRQALGSLAGAVAVAEKELDPGLPLLERRVQTMSHYQVLRTGRDALSFARQGLPIRNFNVWNSLTMVEEAFAHAKGVIESEENILNGNQVTEAVLAISREKLNNIADGVKQPIVAATTALNEEYEK